MCARLTVGASVLGQLVGWPNSFALAALRSEFLQRELAPANPLDLFDGMHLPKRRGGCAAGLGSGGECVVNGLFS